MYANNIYNQSLNTYCISCTCALDLTTYDSLDQAIIKSKYPNINITSGARTTEECIRANLTGPEQALFSTIGEL